MIAWGVLEIIESKSDARHVSRFDSWENVVSGLGTLMGDRARGVDWTPEITTSPERLANLFRFDDVCRRIVSIVVEDALREGYEICGPAPDRIESAFARLEVDEKLHESLIWGRLYGGSIWHLGLPGAAIDPAPLGATGVGWIDVYDRRAVQRGSFVTEKTDPNYGRAVTYRVTPANGGSFEVHRSRCIVFRGSLTGRTEREQQDGWDDSVLETCVRIVRAFNAGHLALDNMLSDASQAVFKLSGLFSAVGKNQGRELLKKRAQVMELTRGLTRSIMLDASENESFEKIPTSFAGVAEAIDRVGIRLAMAADAPVTRLLGTSPAGMNATGESDTRFHYDRVRNYQRTRAKPPLQCLIERLYPGHVVSFRSPWTLSEKEKAELRKIEVDTKAVEIQNEIRTPLQAGLDLGYDPAPALPAPVAPAPVAPAPAPARVADSKPAPTTPAPPETLTVNELRKRDGRDVLRKDSGEADPDGALPFAAYQSKHSRAVRIGVKGSEK